MQARILLCLGLAVTLASAPRAQSNQNPDLDLQLVRIADVQVLGRKGQYPAGFSGIAFSTTICNSGEVPVAWMAPMGQDHPLIAFLIVREANGRLEQISDRSYVKHGFFALNSSSLCQTCEIPTMGGVGEYLGVGCSDTYSAGNNGDQYYLGPADEIDPWMGTWTGVCSHFDRGEPAVAAPADCDLTRSLIRQQTDNLGPIAHRIIVRDTDLDVPGAEFFVQAHYVAATEPEVARSDNIASRDISVSWTGSTWDVDLLQGLDYGPVIERWSGATVSSSTNGAEDGRVHVAVKVTGPVDGSYHYEYAIQNRDNVGGIDALRIPICRDARVSGAGFRDHDSDSTNDWSVQVTSSEIVFSTPDAPLEWNTLTNFWFDCDAAPLTSTLRLGVYDPGAADPEFAVTNTAPGALYNVHLGAGCATGDVPRLYAAGTTGRAALGDESFAVESSGNLPGAPSFLLMGYGGEPTNVMGCTLFTGLTPQSISYAVADESGLVVHRMPVPDDPGFEGMELTLQGLTLNAGRGAMFHTADLSDALMIRVGNTLPDCP